jgi:hypothetical protein
VVIAPTTRTRWLALAAFLFGPGACDGIYSCEIDPGPEAGRHEPEIDYETNEGRYSLTITSADSWPPHAGEVSFELWPEAPDDAGQVELTTEPAFRSTDAEAQRLTIPLHPTGDGAWRVGPIELDAGLWRIPLRLTDDRGRDAIELRIEVVAG